MALQSISANDAKRLIERGPLVVDIREPDEYAREHIPHAISRPVSGLTQGTLDIDKASQIIFHCKSGGRTRSNAARLASAASCEAFMLEGGLDAWKRAGLPVEVDPYATAGSHASGPDCCWKLGLARNRPGRSAVTLVLCPVGIRRRRLDLRRRNRILRPRAIVAGNALESPHEHVSRETPWFN